MTASSPGSSRSATSSPTASASWRSIAASSSNTSRDSRFRPDPGLLSGALRSHSRKSDRGMYQTHGPILEALRVRGISPTVLSAAVNAAEESSRPLRDVLVDDGIITEIELAEALALAYGLKSVDLVGYPIDAAATAKIPIGLARRHRVLGIAIDDEEIIVALADPGDVLALDDVRAATGLSVRPV